MTSAKKHFIRLSGSTLGVLFVGALFAGCSLSPDYKRPEVSKDQPLPATFSNGTVTNAGEWKVAEPSAHLPRGAWWEGYGDAELNRLQAQATQNNQQLAAAVANFAQARAAVKTVRADLFPQVNAGTSFSRERTSANASPTSAASGSSKTFNMFSMTGDVSWELDLWGRVKLASQGAKATLQASVDDMEAVRLAIQAEVTINYFQLQTYDAQYALLKQTTDAYQKALDLTRNRRKAGIASELDVAQAETQLKSAQTQIPAVELQRAQTRNALAVLCGVPATTFTTTPNLLNTTNTPAIPMIVPSEWLESRPDIAGAERRMALANATVGIAKTAFYPRLILNGDGGFQSVRATDWFAWPSHLWALGPSVQLPIFTGGKNRAQLEAAKASFDKSVADYRQTVLVAFQEVEDQLAAQRYLARQLEDARATLASAKRALEISNRRYQAGIEQYLDVITAQTAVLTHEQTVIQLNGQRLASSASLIKALGAGGRPPEAKLD